jgi:hypothetical protein
VTAVLHRLQRIASSFPGVGRVRSYLEKSKLILRAINPAEEEPDVGGSQAAGKG